VGTYPGGFPDIKKRNHDQQPPPGELTWGKEKERKVKCEGVNSPNFGRIRRNLTKMGKAVKPEVIDGGSASSWALGEFLRDRVERRLGGKKVTLCLKGGKGKTLRARRKHQGRGRNIMP